MDNHSFSSQKLVNYVCKKFYSSGPICIWRNAAKCQ